MLALSIVFNVVLFVARADFRDLFCSLQLLYWRAEESALLAYASLMIPVIVKRHKCFDDGKMADEPKRAANGAVRCSFWLVSHLISGCQMDPFVTPNRKGLRRPQGILPPSPSPGES